MSAPGPRFVNVPSAALFAFLEGKGFSRNVRNAEVIFSRRHHNDPRFVVLVYTSVREGAARARKCGADAIRVCAVFTPADENLPSRGVVKLPKVLRTAPSVGSDAMTALGGDIEAVRVQHVLDRVLERMKEAYARVNVEVVKLRAAEGRQPGLTDRRTA